MSKLSLAAKKRSPKFIVCSAHTRQTLALPEQVAWTAHRLETLRCIFRELFGDENFVTLLRAETLMTIPQHLKNLFEAKAYNR